MQHIKRLKTALNDLTRRINALLNVPYFGTLEWQPISELKNVIGDRAEKLAEEASIKLNEPDSSRLEFVLAQAGRIKENAWVKAAETYLDKFNIKIPSKVIKGFVFNVYGTEQPKFKLLIIGQKQGSPKMLLIADPDRKKRIQAIIEKNMREQDKVELEQPKEETE